MKSLLSFVSSQPSFACAGLGLATLSLACASGNAGSGPAGPADAATGSSGTSSGASGTSNAGASGGGTAGATSGSAASGSTASGSATSGAASGSAGASGVASDAGSGGDAAAEGATSSNCASLPLCDDFEADEVGAPPSPSLWSIQWGIQGSSTTSYSIAVDSTQFHSGSKSLKVVGGDSWGPFIFNSSALTKISGGEVYGRFYTRFSTAMPFQHAFFAALGLKADGGPFGNNQSNYVQLAALADGTTPVLQWNYVDTELPQRNGMELAQNVYPAESAWTCIEYHSSMAQGSIEVWINGQVAPGMTFVPGTTAVTPGNMPWSVKKPALDVQSVAFGWVDVHAGTNTLWFDDVALSESRIGCQ